MITASFFAIPKIRFVLRELILSHGIIAMWDMILHSISSNKVFVLKNIKAIKLSLKDSFKRSCPLIFFYSIIIPFAFLCSSSSFVIFFSFFRLQGHRRK